MELMKLMKLSVLTCDCPTSPILKAKLHLEQRWQNGAAGISPRAKNSVSFPSTPKTRSSWACCYAVAWHHPRQRQTSNCINPRSYMSPGVSYQTSQNLWSVMKNRDHFQL